VAAVLTWVDKTGNYSVRSPIAVRGSLFHAPAEVSGSGASGSLTFPVKFGYTGAYTAAPHGLIPATVTSANVLQDPGQTFAPGDVGNGANLHQFNLSGCLRASMPPAAKRAPTWTSMYDPPPLVASMRRPAPTAG
jgi:hypothetical protein